MSLNQENKKSVFHPLYFLFAFIMWILVIGWLAVIFSLSSESADVSSMRSQDLVQRIASSLHLYMSEEFLRCCAHVFEYVVLSVLAYISMFATNHVFADAVADFEQKLEKMKNDNEVYIAVSLWITSLVAAADEYHQIFVSGRSASMFDVFLDVSGAFVLMLIIRIVVSIYAYMKNRKQVLEMISAETHMEEVK
ncbi:MAG: VanZ family protein [Clostridiales bacterium]|nr:VanZ family protein [Clostridiales bacterium]